VSASWLCNSKVREAEKQSSRNRRNPDAVCAVGCADGVTTRRPAAGQSQVAVLLQRVAAVGRPRDHDTVTRIRNGQAGRVRLNRGLRLPNSAANLAPSDEQAMEYQIAFVALVWVQFVTRLFRLVEIKLCP
jgi:hypothetical protein